MNAKRLIPFFVAAGLLAFLAAPALAAPAITGTWEVVATLDGSGQQDQVLETYDSTGTWISTGPSAFASNGQGVWEKTGGRTFSTTVIIFGYDPVTGNLIAKVNAQAEIVVSQDKQSYEGVFTAEIKDLSGNVLVVNTGTVTGTRLTNQ